MSQGVQESCRGLRGRSQGRGSPRCGDGESLPAFCKKQKRPGFGAGSERSRNSGASEARLLLQSRGRRWEGEGGIKKPAS